jgi:hypothetical protein
LGICDLPSKAERDGNPLILKEVPRTGKQEADTDDVVGWVERSETHRDRRGLPVGLVPRPTLRPPARTSLGKKSSDAYLIGVAFS